MRVNLDEQDEQKRQDARDLVRERKAAERYPLWCLDNGDSDDERRYLGPYKTETEAKAAHERNWGMSGPGDGRKLRLRRCRRATAAEAGVDAGNMLDEIAERVDETAADNPLPNSWADWEDELVFHKGQGLEDLREWVSKHLATNVYICEGDEETP